ncbi:hypothetical protein U6N30_04055 [Blastococcus brunescens]|uniref:Uncharacterized protein n=1 Tax=Blastococcus brunescens TaxID=1564165 RepID=A0ABZ1BB42_9ACTN|nr:hypothetical protein [Blastococcus sp. BMG 8361]WRL66844.1 hypothetical protein U6N30_04055 [Blastococcus sp. BMG 8361]
MSAQAIMGILDSPPAEITSGRILFEGATCSPWAPRNSGWSVGPGSRWSSRTRCRR